MLPSDRENNKELFRCLTERQRRKAQTSLLDFIRYTKFDYEVNWHHAKICSILDEFVFTDNIPRLMVFAPPRTGKSEIVSRRLPAFIHGVNPNAEIMSCTYNSTLAADLTVDVQRIIDTPLYRDIFPNSQITPEGKLSKYKRTQLEYELMPIEKPNGRFIPQGTYRAQGVGGSYTGFGADFICMDDPYRGRFDADSEVYRESLYKFFTSTLYTRLEKKGKILITLTRWREDDLASTLLDLARREPGADQWKVVSFPAIRESGEDSEDPRQVGEPLWPNKYDLEAMNKIRVSIGSHDWAALYQQHPRPDGGALFKNTMFRFGPMPDVFDYSFITADTAYDSKKENDFTVFTAFGVKGQELFIRDVFREQIKAADIEVPAANFIKRFQKSYSFRGAYIEPKGHGIYLNQMLPRKPHGCMIPGADRIKEFFDDRRLDKVARANNAIPHLVGRVVTINEAIPMKEELVAEAMSFPRGKNDDFVDTLVDGIKFTYSRKMSLCDLA